MNRIGEYSFFCLVLFYLAMLGGGTYEHLNITIPVTKQVPDSLAILKGEFGFNPVRFWVFFRPLTILLFIVNLIIYWHTASRSWLLTAFFVDCAITASTFFYFAPQTGQLMEAIQSPEKWTPALIDSILLWKNLNWVRLAAFYLSSILLLIAWKKSNR